MADSNITCPRCPCGFWGTAQTGGLCSKCYREKEKKLLDASGPIRGATALPMAELNTPLEQAMSSSTIEDTTSVKSAPEVSVDSSSSENSKDSEPANKASENPDTSEGSSSDNGSSNKRDISEVQDPAESEHPQQKNKKRCFTCHVRLELAVREIGRCKCNYVFCQLHRLPEQHDCVFDHKSTGRKEARDKMVSPKKHAGTSIRRMDSHTS